MTPHSVIMETTTMSTTTSNKLAPAVAKVLQRGVAIPANPLALPSIER